MEGTIAGQPTTVLIAGDDAQQLTETVRRVIRQTVNWPSTTQSLKSALTSGFARTARYLGEKYSKWKKGKSEEKAGKD